MSYQHDRAWSDRYIPQLRTLIGPYLLAPSSLEQDTKEAADLVVLRARDLTIACRVRRPGYAMDFPNQFTIRSKRSSGVTTEFEKIIDGWGDWFFYGHATSTFPEIKPWWLIDLSSFRSHLIRRTSRTAIKTDELPNGDGTYFRWFQIESFPSVPPLVIAQSEPTAVTACARTTTPLTADEIPFQLR